MNTEKKQGWYPSPRYLFRKNIILNYLKKQETTGKTVLEIGYGAGDMMVTCVKLGMLVTGFDSSEMAYQEACARIRQNGASDITLLDSMDSLAPESFDYIICCEVLEHIEKDEQALTQWAGLLKKGGTLILSVPAKMSKWGVSDRWAGHYRRYERDELKNKLTAQGFACIKIKSYLFPFNLVLDRMLNKEKQKLIDEAHLNTENKADASKASGVVRKSNKLFRMISNPVVLAPCFLVQKMFLNTDLGSGLISISKRK